MSESVRAELEAEGTWLLSRQKYDRLVLAGVLDENDRVELLYGRLVPMSPQGWAHAWVVQELAYRLIEGVGGRGRVRTHSPLAAGDDSEPEPDVLVHPVDEGRGAHPQRAFLVAEVSETSLRKDRVIKAALYAQIGVPDYWVIDLHRRCVYVHRGPGTGGFADVVQVDLGGTLTLLAFPDVSIDVAAPFP